MYKYGQTPIFQTKPQKFTNAIHYHMFIMPNLCSQTWKSKHTFRGPKMLGSSQSQKHHINPKTLNTQKNFFVKIVFEIPMVLQHSLDHWSMIVVILGIRLTSTWDNGRKSRPQYKNQPIVSTIWHSCFLKQLIINSILKSLVNPKTT
jgi:hypothetical protein